MPRHTTRARVRSARAILWRARGARACVVSGGVEATQRVFERVVAQVYIAAMCSREFCDGSAPQCDARACAVRVPARVVRGFEGAWCMRARRVA
eukprot:11192924-Lingulodinium_polyedra.AAC.1